MPTSNAKLRRLVIVELVLIAILGAWVGAYYYHDGVDTLRKDRDALRLAELNTIQAALVQYAYKYGAYPACLYTTKDCASLEGNVGMTVVPRDPLTNLPYSYAAYNKNGGSTCTGYHLGASLERKGSQSLIAGADAPPKSDALLCSGSAKDFSGLSYAPGGQLCGLEVGVAQPTTSEKGESCYDVERTRLPAR